MRPIRQICERCRDRVNIDLNRSLLEERLDNHQCMFVWDDRSGNLLVWSKDHEPEPGKVPGFCFYPTETAVLQET